MEHMGWNRTVVWKRTGGALFTAVIAVAVFAGASACAQTAPPSQPPPFRPNYDITTERLAVPFLVGWWPFDETTGLVAPDAEGSNVGTLVGFTTPRWLPGQLGRALEFNGAGTDAVVIPNAAGLNPSSQISLSAWIYSYTAGSAHAETIIAKGIGSGTQYSLAIEPGGLVQFTLDGLVLTSEGKISPNAWMHVFSSYDGETMRLYLNGNPDRNSMERSGPILATESDIHIGSAANADQPNTFNGLIDDVRIYSLGLNFASVSSLYDQGVHDSNSALQVRADNVSYGDQYIVDLPSASQIPPYLSSWWAGWWESIHSGLFGPGFGTAVECKTILDQTGALLSCYLERNPSIAAAIVWHQTGSAPQTSVAVPWAQWNAQQKADLAEAFYYAFQWLNGELQSFNGYQLVDPPVNQFNQPDAAPALTEFSSTAAWHLYVNTIAQSLAVEVGGFVPWSITGYQANELQALFDSSNIVSLQMASANSLDPSVQPVWGYVPAGYTMDAPPTTYFQWLVNNNIIQGNHSATIDQLINWSRYNLLHILNWTDISALQFQGWWNYRGSSPASAVLAGTLGPYQTANPIPPFPPGLPHNWVYGCHGVVTLYRGLLRTINIPTDYVIEFGHGMPIWWTISQSLSHGDDVESQILDKNSAEMNQPNTWEKWPKYAPAKDFPISLTDFNNWFTGPNSNYLNVGRQAFEMWTIQYPDADMLTMYCSDKAHGLSPANGTVLASLQGSLLLDLFPLSSLESMGFWNTLAAYSAQFGFCGP
jgi:hypothetical protein